MIYDNNFLEKLNHIKNKTIYAKVIALTFDEAPIETIEGRITAGSINVDGNSAVRRTCSLTIASDKFDYSDYLWSMKTKFQLEIGVENTIDPRYQDIIWFPQGIYILTSFNVSRNTTQFTINLSGKDKMCLLNGDLGGNLESSIDFGQIEEEDRDGNWVIKKIPIHEIIRNAVHVYGKEPYHNIIINDLDSYGVELLEYNCSTPAYLYRSAEEDINVYTNILIDNTSTLLYRNKDDKEGIYLYQLTNEDLESLTAGLDDSASDGRPLWVEDEFGNRQSYYFTKIEQGMTAGYRETELTYAGDLIANVGETLTSVLDKIKNMLVEFEYFYNLQGQFVFQKKQSFISTMWSAATEQNSLSANDIAEELPAVLKGQTSAYIFNNNELVTAFNNNPNIANLRNDYSIWGERTTISGAVIPIHMRYAIDTKPLKYKNIYVSNDNLDIIEYNQKYNTTLSGQEVQYTYISSDNYSRDDEQKIVYCDWREVIYQMTQDYYKYNHLNDFELLLIEANPEYPTGKTEYESYYVDITSFWRDLYAPDLKAEYNHIENLVNEQTTIVSKDTEILEDIESDYNVLKKAVDDNNYALAHNLALFWTYKDQLKENVPGAYITFYNQIKEYVNSDNFTSPKYEFMKDFVDNSINNTQSNFDLNVQNLKVYYEEKKSELNEKEEELKESTAKRDNLKERIENYYLKDTDKHYGWLKSVYEQPELLNFWFDFLDSNGELAKYSVSNIGNRPKAIQDTNIKSIYFRETPQVVFREPDEGIVYQRVNITRADYYSAIPYYRYDTQLFKFVLIDKTKEPFDTAVNYYIQIRTQLSGFKVIQVPMIEQLFTISAQGKSAKDSLDELLYQHSCCIETATLTTIPIYYLQPNTRITVYDRDSNLNGDYILNKITIPLNYNGTMSLSITKTLENIV